MKQSRISLICLKNSFQWFDSFRSQHFENTPEVVSAAFQEVVMIPGVNDKGVAKEFSHVSYGVCMDSAVSNKRALEHFYQRLPEKQAMFRAWCRMHRKSKAHSQTNLFGKSDALYVYMCA